LLSAESSIHSWSLEYFLTRARKFVSEISDVVER
jgi:hypothetical protein